MAVAVDNRRDVISIVEGLNRRILAIPFDAGLALEAEPTPVLPQRDCAVTPDLAVSPERIERAPGATAVLEIALRNVGTAPHGCNDIVLSLSDGLRVVETPGMTNPGQRAAVPIAAIKPNESVRFSVTVAAAAALTTAPVFVGEQSAGAACCSVATACSCRQPLPVPMRPRHRRLPHRPRRCRRHCRTRPASSLPEPLLSCPRCCWRSD